MEDVNRVLLDVYKDLYYHEDEKLDRVGGRAGVLLAVASLLGGALTFYMSGVQLSQMTVASSFHLVFVVLMAMSLVVAIRYMIMMMTGYEAYRVVASAEALGDYAEQVVEYNLQVDKKDQKDVRQEIDELLAHQYREAATHNRQVNAQRSKAYHDALKCLIAALVLATLTAIPYFVMQQTKEAYKVEIINLHEGNNEQGSGEAETETAGTETP